MSDPAGSDDRAGAEITVAICTHDRYDLLAKAVASVAMQDLARERYRILVVDNSPDPDRARAASTRFRHLSEFSYVHEMTPGLSHARNIAAQVCTTPLIAFLDDDAVASPHWLQGLLEAFAAFGEEAMVVGGRVLPIWGAPRPRWLHDKMLAHLSLIDWGGELRIAGGDEWFCGANIGFRTRAIIDCGGFATELGRKGSSAALLSNEEIQLMARIKGRGGLMVYAPHATVEHWIEPARLSHAWFRKRTSWQATSDYLMDPERHAGAGAEQWRGVRQYLAARPQHERGVRGLLSDTEDPELFHWQLGALYQLTLGLLSGFEGVNFD